MGAPALICRFPAQPEHIGPVRRAVRAYAEEHGSTDPDGVALALSEAATNAVLHAYVDAPEPGEVEVVAQRITDNGIVLAVCDDGRGMKPRPDSPGVGLGLALAAAIASRLEVESRPGGGTRVCMTFAATV
jgi:stage II sporulation protein AB (anti-sigma F factor)